MCSVVDCGSWRRSAPRFKLPEDPERRLEWVQFLFDVNSQRLKESSWTDITICSEHFTDDSFVEDPAPPGSVQLKPGAVPSVCIKSRADEPEPKEEPVEIAAFAPHCDQLKTCDSPSSFSEDSELSSVAVPVSPVPSDTSDAFMCDYGQMLQKIVNIDMIREKAALLQMKGKYVVNENRLLKLFSSRCPLCGSKVRVEKVTHGVLIVLNQLCLQCEYRNQWKSQVSASVPAADDHHLTGSTEVISESTSIDDDSSITGVSELVAADEESDPMEETEDSCDEGDMESDYVWNPAALLLANKCQNESDEESEDEEVEEEDDDPPLVPKHGQLCTECGMFFNKRRPHTCEHKTKPYSCNICGKRCVSEIALNSHSRIHNENYEHRCKYCHVTFKTKVDKITHEQIHLTQGKPYKCPDCSETFATNKERKIHLEDHRGPKQLKCHICGIEFNRTRSLQRHLVVHTGVRPHKCSVCQRGFNQASHLKSHMRLHTGERPYKCQHCDKRFNHNVSLKSHVQRYHASNSGRERKRGKTSKAVSDTDARENGSMRSGDTGSDHAEEERDYDKDRINMAKKRSTGRPIGRPKRNASGNSVLAGKMRRPGSNAKTGKSKVRRSKRTQCSDDELSQSDVSFDSKEEDEEKSHEGTLSTSRSRGRPKHSESDTDCDREDSKKKRHNSQNSGRSSGRRRGRPRKNQAVDET